MKPWFYGISILFFTSSLTLGGEADGTYKASEGEFTIGYALADRDADGNVRILLAGEQPDVPDRDHHLDRLEAVGEAAGGHLIVEPTAEGDGFNVTVRIPDLGYGGGGQYPSRIEIGSGGVKGAIDTEVMSDARLEVSFEAEYLPERNHQEDLPADGGKPGAVLLEQLNAVASGDLEAILKTLSPEQRAQFEALSEEERQEALEFTVELAPRNVKITGGALYDGYAIVEFEGETEGSPISGRALLSREGDKWLIREVSSELG